MFLPPLAPLSPQLHAGGGGWLRQPAPAATDPLYPQHGNAVHPSGQTLEAQAALSQLPFVMFNLGPKYRPRRSSSGQKPPYMGTRVVDTLLCKRGNCVLGTPGQDPEKPERLGGWEKFAERGLSGPPHNRAGLEFLLALRSRTQTSPVCL